MNFSLPQLLPIQRVVKRATRTNARRRLCDAKTLGNIPGAQPSSSSCELWLADSALSDNRLKYRPSDLHSSLLWTTILPCNRCLQLAWLATAADSPPLRSILPGGFFGWSGPPATGLSISARFSSVESLPLTTQAFFTPESLKAKRASFSRLPESPGKGSPLRWSCMSSSEPGSSSPACLNVLWKPLGSGRLLTNRFFSCAFLP